MKFFNENLSDGTLKYGKIKLEIFKLDIKKSVKFQKKFLVGGGGREEIDIWGWWWEEGAGKNFFLEFDIFFDIQFKNTSNFIFPGFKVPYETFLFKDFRTGPTFWHM